MIKATKVASIKGSANYGLVSTYNKIMPLEVEEKYVELANLYFEYFSLVRELQSRSEIISKCSFDIHDAKEKL